MSVGKLVGSDKYVIIINFLCHYNYIKDILKFCLNCPLLWVTNTFLTLTVIKMGNPSSVILKLLNAPFIWNALLWVINCLYLDLWPYLPKTQLPNLSNFLVNTYSRDTPIEAWMRMEMWFYPISSLTALCGWLCPDMLRPVAQQHAESIHSLCTWLWQSSGVIHCMASILMVLV
jgi:hypothetical protein